jgi:hypothetical protein
VKTSCRTEQMCYNSVIITSDTFLSCSAVTAFSFCCYPFPGSSQADLAYFEGTDFPAHWVWVGVGRPCALCSRGFNRLERKFINVIWIMSFRPLSIFAQDSIYLRVLGALSGYLFLFSPFTLGRRRPTWRISKVRISPPTGSGSA